MAPVRSRSRRCRGKQRKGRNTARSTTAHLLADLVRLPTYRLYGRVTAVQGMLVEIGGVEHLLSIGGRCTVGRTRRPPGGVRGRRLPHRPRAADAVQRARRRRPRLQGGDRGLRSGGAAASVLARPRRQRAGRAARRQGPAADRRRAVPAARLAAAGAFAPARRAARSISACAPSTPFSPAAAASAWASSPAPASASRRCCR